MLNEDKCFEEDHGQVDLPVVIRHAPTQLIRT